MSDSPSRLLVVDDELANRLALSRRLAKQGYEVDTATGGAEALDKILREPFDLILLDQMMPGMSGIDMLRLLRATYSATELPVIMVTALDAREMIVQALDAGANDYVVKPVELPVIMARIEAQLDRSRTARLKIIEQAPAAPDGAWDWDPVSRTAHYSARWKQIVGHAPQEIGDDLVEWLDRIHPHDLLRVRKQLNAHIEGLEPEFRCEHRLRHKNGDYRWVLCRGLSLRGPDGELLRLAGSMSDIDDRKGSDPLTGLTNRRQFLDRLTVALQAGDRKRATAALMALDLDGFASINDTAGHQAGDRVLMEVAARLRDTVTRSAFGVGAVVGRLGGDEFGVLVSCEHGTCDIGRLADAILAALEPPIDTDSQWLQVSASIGVVIGTRVSSAADLIRDADLALEQARDLGRGRWHLYEPSLRDRANIQTQIARDLRYAVERDELVAVFQPQVDLRTRAITGFEALMRWRHPDLGTLLPRDFMPVAESSGIIVPAGEWILREACRHLAAWQRDYPEALPLSVSVNVSARQLGAANLPHTIRTILRETGVGASSLKIEITESALIAEKEAARGVLGEIAAMGVGIELDDFGTGYASLSYLNMVRFESLKIDRSFISRMESDPESRAIIRTVIGLARELKMGVIAEGIETEAETERLIEMGCYIGQGYYYSMPIDAAAADRLLLAASQGRDRVLHPDLRPQPHPELDPSLVA